MRKIISILIFIFIFCNYSSVCSLADEGYNVYNPREYKPNAINPNEEKIVFIVETDVKLVK